MADVALGNTTGVRVIITRIIDRLEDFKSSVAVSAIRTTLLVPLPIWNILEMSKLRRQLQTLNSNRCGGILNWDNI
jgi:hypothetical protein